MAAYPGILVSALAVLRPIARLLRLAASKVSVNRSQYFYSLIRIPLK